MRANHLLLLGLGFSVLMMGCTAGLPRRLPQAATPSTAPTRAIDTPITRWLAQAPRPAVIASSITPDQAPDAVQHFQSISAKVAAMYRKIYEDIQVASTEEQPANCSMQLSEGSSKAQQAITTWYQQMVAEIAQQKRELKAYTETLRQDNTISNITDSLTQTSLLVQIGNDSHALSQQLKSTEEGVRLLYNHRLHSTHDDE